MTGRRRRSLIPFLRLPSSDVWRDAVWRSNDLLATLARLVAMLDREGSETGRIRLTPEGIRALTGAGKVDRAWRILETLAEIGVCEVERIATPRGADRSATDRLDLERSGRSSRRSAGNRADHASILLCKYPELLGIDHRRDRQSRGGPWPAPPARAPEVRRDDTPRGVVEVERPGMAKRTPEETARIEQQAAEARERIRRATARLAAPTRAQGER